MRRAIDKDSADTVRIVLDWAQSLGDARISLDSGSKLQWNSAIQ